MMNNILNYMIAIILSIFIISLLYFGVGGINVSEYVEHVKEEIK